jgi:two-component system cell cycle sensor histidine kinase/response regulator CckA
MPFTQEFRIVRPSGEIRWFANVAQVECSTSGEVESVVGTVQDITARKRAEWALTAYNRILEMIAAGARLQTILEEVVRLVEEQLPGSICSVLIVDKAASCLRAGAVKSLPEAYNRAVDGVPIGPKAGSCGTAAFRKATVTVTDIAQDPLWDEYREIALAHGLRSCVSVPILSSGNVPGNEKGEVIGTFALYNRMPGAFDRVTYAILSGAELLVRRAVQADQPDDAHDAADSARVVEAAHLAGVAIERDQAELAFRESEQRFRTVIDSAPPAIFIRDLEGRYTFVNRATAEMFGVPLTDWIGKRSREILPAHIADLFEASDRAVLASKGQVNERFTPQLLQGREATVLATHMLLRNDSGAYGICGILSDLTDLVVAQRELELLWQQAPEPLCVAGFDGRLKRINPAWSTLLGWSTEELLGRPISEWVHPEDAAKLTEALEELTHGRRVHRFVNRCRCKDGSTKWFSWDAIALESERAIYGFVRDVTEERRLEEQFRQAQKMEAVGQLASGVAHDFNNLLMVINGYTDILLGGALGVEQRDVLTEMLDAGQRATELTSQLLAFSRKAIVEPKILDVNQVIGSSARMLRRLIGENIELVTRLGPVSPVRIDPGQLEQVFMNLAVNARDAMPGGGRLTITTAEVELTSGRSSDTAIAAGHYVRLSVTDTGTGMPPEVKARIFEPFFTTKGPSKGTGLGLATVYGIVRQAGGDIEPESELGAGTTFRILLPAVRGAVAGPTAVVNDVAPRGSESILLVEDEKGVRDVAAAMLGTLGYRVIVAESGAEAARIVTEHPGQIDLLLTDVVMPDLGGRTLAAIVRAQRPGVQVLFMSGYTDDAIIRSGIESAQEWFIQKPIARLTLARRLREVLDGPPK